jgi:hypothetical protein
LIADGHAPGIRCARRRDRHPTRAPRTEFDRVRDEVLEQLHDLIAIGKDRWKWTAGDDLSVPVGGEWQEHLAHLLDDLVEGHRLDFDGRLGKVPHARQEALHAIRRALDPGETVLLFETQVRPGQAQQLSVSRNRDQ